MMRESLTILSSRNCGKKHVSYNTVLGMENVFCQCSGHSPLLLKGCFYNINRLFQMFRFSQKYGIPDYLALRKIKHCRGKVFFAVMGLNEAVIFKHTLKKCHKKLILYVFDCWESQWEKWKKIFDEINPWAICFAYKKSKEHFSELISNCWFLPQSMDSRYFHDYEKGKERLFMQVGRRTDKLHNMVINYLKSNRIQNSRDNYIYEKKKGSLIFEDTSQLAEEMGKTYFFIAAPQNIENDKYTGSISEVTARFYEAMACKTLIIGIKPEDSFDELFPYYEAMIEVNEESFERVINQFLEDREYYNAIVDRNFNYVMQHHRWENLFESLLTMIKLA